MPTGQQGHHIIFFYLQTTVLTNIVEDNACQDDCPTMIYLVLQTMQKLPKPSMPRMYNMTNHLRYSHIFSLFCGEEGARIQMFSK
jgi:hypothetical protein